MRIFLDDTRPTPAGYVRAYWPEEVYALLQGKEVVEEISLDHDLGDDKHGTGYDVLTWIDAQVSLNYYVPPAIIIHSSNASGVQRMQTAAARIRRVVEANLANHRQWNGSFELPPPYA